MNRRARMFLVTLMTLVGGVTIASLYGDAVKQATSTGLFDIMKAHFAERFAAQGLALSLELNEFSEAGTLKHNNLHARFT